MDSAKNKQTRRESRKRRSSSNNLDNAVLYFKNVKERVKVKNNINLQTALELLEETSKTKGLPAEYITDLVDAAANTNIPDSVGARLIRALTPSTVVPEQAVINAISHMCTNKPSIRIQTFFLRWILVVYDYIDKKENLHKLYGIIFYFLENQTMMPYVCHLLYLLTQKEDVRLFRVRRLLMIQNKMGAQPYLTGLLAIYQLYYPHMMSVVMPKRSRLFFPSRDKQWEMLIRKVQENNEPTNCESTLALSHLKSIENSRQTPRTKRRKTDPVPTIHSDTTRETNTPKEEILTALENNKVPFVQITDFKCILENVERIEFPSQIGSVLRSQLGQHMMSYTRDQTATTRFSYWLQATLTDEILDNSWNAVDTEITKALLVKLIDFTDFLQEGLPAVDHFLSRFLSTWNGLDFRSEILQLVARCRICTFGELNDNILEPLRKLFCCSSVYFKCQVVHCLTLLVRNFAANEWPRYMEWVQKKQEHAKSGKAGEPSCHYTLFQEDREECDPQGTITDLMDYISQLCITGLRLEANHNLLLFCALSFFEEVSCLETNYRVPFVHLSPLLSSAFVVPFTCLNGMGISSVCSTLCNYKRAVASVKERRFTGELFETDTICSVSQLNALILDAGDALWKGNLANKNESSKFFNFDPREIHPSLPVVENRFVLYMHPGLMGFTLRFLTQTQSEDNLGHPRGIKLVKRVYLEYLDRENLYGPKDFVTTFITPKRLSSNITQQPSMVHSVTIGTKANADGVAVN
ncbi:centromere protein I-like [Mizuhopecten yessoensis]|uniref:Centromere protein I n=1 Tax=Mizuhopecten yessoensis TaxID=6573 RepID=A0A210QLR5_MIZYE|nr:centromere protein I-like [Mizuhopecten yessoensis]OWF49678.1 Centromere protein I [Mizuhopecten yessoensis]